MSGHDFEKQVRHKLDDLKMKPSAQAWENIEESLRERKRRVAPFFWMPLLLIGLAAGGYFIFDKSGSQKEVVAAAVNHKNANLNDKAPQAQAPNPNASGVTTPQTSTTEADASGIIAQHTDTPQTHAPHANSPHANSQINASRVLSPHSAARLMNAQRVFLPEAKAPQASNNYNIFNYISNDKIASRVRVSLNSKIIAKPSLPKYTDPSPKKLDLKKKQSRWSYGLTGTAGISSVSEGNFFDLNINKSQVEDVATTAAFAPQPYRPSSISSGFTYSLGAFVKRDLSKRFSLSVGLNYLQLNTQNKVGSRINARQVVNNGNSGYIIVTSFYSLQQSQPSEYRNRYHFLEVPIELHTRLNRSEKLPLYLNTGIAVSRLLKSNSLHFDGSTGVYYKNDRLLNQTQLATKAGFSVGLFNKTTRPVWVGPFARYNVSKILQKDVSASKSFASFGVDVKLFIK
jgi:hypothetical protein